MVDLLYTGRIDKYSKRQICTNDTYIKRILIEPNRMKLILTLESV